MLICRSLRQLSRCRSASVALEFALISPILIGLLLAIIQVSLNYLAQAVLDRTTYSTATLIRYGVPQIAQMDLATFKSNIVCQTVPAVFDCSKLIVHVLTNNHPDEKYAWFFSYVGGSGVGAAFVSGIQIPWCNVVPTTGSAPACVAPVSTGQIYCPGAPGSYVLVQLAYPIVFQSMYWTQGVINSASYFVSSHIIVNDDYGATYSNPSGC